MNFKLNVWILILGFFFQTNVFADSKSGFNDYKLFKSVTLPNFPHISVPIFKSAGTKGPGILMVHGNSSSSRSFQKQFFGTLGKKYKIFLMDLPGHGKASKVDSSLPLPLQPNGLPLGFPEYQTGLIEAIATVANDPSVNAKIFVGWSLGGDLLLLTRGAGLLPQASGFFIFGTAPAGANPPTAEIPFDAPYVPGIPGLAILASFGFSFQADPISPIGFNLNGKFVDPVPPYAPAPISNYSNIGKAYINAFFKPSVVGSPAQFLEDGVVRSDDRFRASLGVIALGLLPAGAPALPDELLVLQSLAGAPGTSDDVPIAVAVGTQDRFVNTNYLTGLKDAGAFPTLWKNNIYQIGQAGHAAHYENPTRFNQLVDQFVMSLFP